jgi:Reverse transcriptase (RNA-dependent DNA polymerase)
LAEGERNKVIQSIPKNPGNVEDMESIFENESQSKSDEEEANDEPKLSNSIPFPSTAAENVDVVPETNTESQPQAYGRGQRARKAPGEYKAMNEGLVAATALDDDLQSKYQSSIHSEHSEPTYNLPPDFAFIGFMNSEPKSLDEALRGPKAKEWQTALEYEINQLEKLGTWVVEELPKGHTAIPCSEVLKIKRGPDGEIKSYRVRIVAGGHRQIEGINYTETFSSAAKMPTVRAVLANAAEQNWEIEHINIKSAYLSAPLKETIFMHPPRGVLKPSQEGKVLRLLKGLYGLKQAGRGWYQEMSRVLIKELGFNRSAIDHSVFIRRSEGEHTVIAVATDDMALTSR